MKKVSKIKKISKGSKSDGKKMKAGRFGKWCMILLVVKYN